MEATSKVGVALGEIFDHIVRPPKHHDIEGYVGMADINQDWRFLCRTCLKEWRISRGDLEREENLNAFTSTRDGPQRIIKEMLKIPGAVRQSMNAWDKVQDGFLDDDKPV